jgi:hypothetical protein
MKGRFRRRVVLGAGAALAVAGGGAALAATQLGTPQEESQAVINDAAKQLGVQPSALSSALKKALEDRVDAAVAAGKLTKAEGDALKARIESGGLPLFFGGLHGPGGRHLAKELHAAAAYLGLTAAQVRTDLESGKTLAQIAQAEGKSVPGLVDALVAAARKDLDAAVATGRLTKAQEQSILSRLKQRITDRVNGVAPEHFGAFRGFRAFRPGLIAPPPESAGPWN